MELRLRRGPGVPATMRPWGHPASPRESCLKTWGGEDPGRRWVNPLSIYSSIDLSIHLSVDLSIYLFIDRSIYQSIYRSIHPSINLSIRLSMYEEPGILLEVFTSPMIYLRPRRTWCIWEHHALCTLWHSFGTWPIYRWLMMIYLINMVMFHFANWRKWGYP